MHSFSSFLAAFEMQCQRQGDSTALVHNEHTWTYAELDCASDKMATDLLEQGIGRDSIVALFCERSMQAIASMIAVMKSGAAFMPVDMAFPDERIHFLLDDAAASGIIADEEQAERVASLGLSKEIAVLSISNSINIAGTPALTIPVNSASDRTPTPISNAEIQTADPIAYVMYTSGSTGKPKGVVISHAALACYCIADIDAYELTASDRTLQFSTLSFDISIEEIFPPLCVGSTVVLRPSGRSDAQIELSDIIETYQISAVHLATGYWHEWVDIMKSADACVPSSLRLMVVTGEKVSPEHYYRWLTLESKPVLWANAYGPTEATVSATVFVPPTGWQGKALPIGKPLLGYSAYILDKDLHPVPRGKTGDLYIGGGALSEGYLNRPELNESVFLSDPFAPETGARMYKTGDLARWLDDGNIDYAGRVDHQIKVGSYRVEPGEIENIINSHSGVNESLVSAQTVNGKTTLIAYVASEDESLDISDIADFLSEKLPAFMLPGRYLLMKVFPKTINGKIDRDALPNAQLAVVARRAVAVAPQSEIENKLCDIWCDILSQSDISIDDSFISLGGDSLMAIRTISRIQKELDFTISTRDFFFLDTVALLAGHMEGKAVQRRVPAPEPLFINSRSRQIYAVLQRPAAHNDNNRGLLLVPPLGNEQRRVQRPLRNLMQNLSRQGYTLMRFDWRGTANSSGSTDQINTLQPWIEDLEDAAEQLANHVTNIDMVAIRFGALIAAQAPVSSSPINNRYYWDPILSGKHWLEEMEELQKGIVNDTYRFLRARKLNQGKTSEYAGIEINDSLKDAIENESFNARVLESNWNQSAHLIVPTALPTNPFGTLDCNLHTVDEPNNWTDPRTTTNDMNINKAASLLADLLVEHQGSNSGVHRINRS